MPFIDDPPFEGVPAPTGRPLYGDRFVKALRVAAIAHGSQRHKSSDPESRPIPYISHPLGVCSIAQGYGADEDEAIAALLHDVLEDVTPTDAAIRTVRWFGERVFRIVEDCTHGMPGPDGKKRPTADRRAAYLPRLATADRSALLVSASDKLHNARSIVADLRVVGHDVWRRFNLRKQEQLAWYEGLVGAYQANPAHHAELVDELARLVQEMRRLADHVEVAAAR
jgi:(p)ppGpp synthase/HD superfamily hydrolase